MPMPADKIRTILEQKFQSDEIEIIDTMGNQDYYHIDIKSSQFNGLTKLKQHKMVYQLLNDVIGSKVHSITLNTEIME